MHHQEGVIKYQLNHTNQPVDDRIQLNEINAWRCILMQLELMGQDANRYEGYGYGNISQRTTPDSDHFIISGTQTGHLPILKRDHFAIVEQANPKLNRLTSHGSCKPSSEALTHAMVYQKDKNIQTVIHVHCPEIWQNTIKLQIPYTNQNVEYGTPAMAAAVENLFNQGEFSLFSMLGHEDGVIAFGNSLQKAAALLIAQLSRAIELNLQNS